MGDLDTGNVPFQIRWNKKNSTSDLELILKSTHSLNGFYLIYLHVLNMEVSPIMEI